MSESGQDQKSVQKEQVLQEKIKIWDKFLGQGGPGEENGGLVYEKGPPQVEKGQKKWTQQNTNQMQEITKSGVTFKGGTHCLQQKGQKNTFLTAECSECFTKWPEL